MYIYCVVYYYLILRSVGCVITHLYILVGDLESIWDSLELPLLPNACFYQHSQENPK